MLAGEGIGVMRMTCICWSCLLEERVAYVLLGE